VVAEPESGSSGGCVFCWLLEAASREQAFVANVYACVIVYGRSAASAVLFCVAWFLLLLLVVLFGVDVDVDVVDVDVVDVDVDVGSC
jgi:hypothetical protein